MHRILRQPLSPIAYFSMEIAVDPLIPTYSGGLGVLAGDMLREAADLGLPMLGMTLLYRKGYFRQHLNAEGYQSESPVTWFPEEKLERLTTQIHLTLEGRQIQVGAWRFELKGLHGHKVFVYFLDTDLSENSPWDRTLTDSLYGGDEHYRLCQEFILGFGGIALLRALGHQDIHTYHMNEGHSAFLTLALLEERKGKQSEVRKECIFTTHTPVPAGHDQFPLDLVRQVLGEARTQAIIDHGCCPPGILNMTFLGLSFSRYINGVAMKHGQISQGLFPHYPIESITNGVHAPTWMATPFTILFDRTIPHWREDNRYLRHVVGIPLSEIREAHQQTKQALLGEVQRRTSLQLDPTIFTLGFARRATAYKRANLLFSDLERLKEISRKVGPIQILYAGKAHPKDDAGKAMIQEILRAALNLQEDIKILYLEEYDMQLAKYLCAGVDLWLNTPQKPQEASGTSGMKAALNGVPSLSILDGWWIEGHIEGVTGWAIGNHSDLEDGMDEAESLYQKLEEKILPLFYQSPESYDEVMRQAIALNASFFTTQRMLLQYLRNAYLRYEF